MNEKAAREQSKTLTPTKVAVADSAAGATNSLKDTHNMAKSIYRFGHERWQAKEMGKMCRSVLLKGVCSGGRQITPSSVC